MYLLPPPRKISFWQSKKFKYLIAALLDLSLITAILFFGSQPAGKIFSPLISPLTPLTPLTNVKSDHQVFGFAPYWNIDKLDGVNFKVLTTFAYFGVDVSGNGDLDKDSDGYETFKSSKATQLFKKAHANGTRVVLTLTQMKNDPILQLLDDPAAQTNAIDQAVRVVKQRGIDGINIDFEYAGDPGDDYRNKFSGFVGNLTDKMHREMSNSQVTVSVYATSVKEPKIYDIPSLGKVADGVFMMAYDFAVAGSDNAIPTAPMNGHENGKYWYDVATAVNDFLKDMPASKLILGVPYYGYNYLVYEPAVNAETRPWYSWRGKPASQTYSTVVDKFSGDNPDDVDRVTKGWDNNGKVGYIAYHVVDTDTWRMVFMEDARSLGIKYDFAKGKKLAGVGIWALGNDDGKQELWNLLAEKFGSNQFDSSDLAAKPVKDINE